MDFMNIVGKLSDALRRRTRQYFATAGGKKIEIIGYPDGTREVLYNGVVYSRLRPKSILTHSYWDYFLPLAYLYGNPKVLMIGLGGGTIAYQFEKAAVHTSGFDIVEIDPDMVELSRVFYPEMRANIMQGDGFEYIRGNREPYDIIILDAYVNYSIPEAFTSKAFVENAYASLSSNGILAINYLHYAKGGQSAQAFISILKERFDVYILETGAALYNTIILASKRMDGKTISGKVSANMPKEYSELNLMRSYADMKRA